MEMRAKARRLAQKDGLALIVVDYIQLMQGELGRRQPRAGDLPDLAGAQDARP